MHSPKTLCLPDVSWSSRSRRCFEFLMCYCRIKQSGAHGEVPALCNKIHQKKKSLLLEFVTYGTLPVRILWENYNWVIVSAAAKAQMTPFNRTCWNLFPVLVCDLYNSGTCCFFAGAGRGGAAQWNELLRAVSVLGSGCSKAREMCNSHWNGRVALCVGTMML